MNVFDKTLKYSELKGARRFLYLSEMINLHKALPIENRIDQNGTEFDVPLITLYVLDGIPPYITLEWTNTSKNVSRINLRPSTTRLPLHPFPIAGLMPLTREEALKNPYSFNDNTLTIKTYADENSSTPLYEEKHVFIVNPKGYFFQPEKNGKNTFYELSTEKVELAEDFGIKANIKRPAWTAFVNLRRIKI